MRQVEAGWHLGGREAKTLPRASGQFSSVPANGTISRFLPRLIPGRGQGWVGRPEANGKARRERE